MIYKLYLVIPIVFILSGCSTTKNSSDDRYWEKYKKENPSSYLSGRPVLSNDLSDRFVELTEKDIKRIKKPFLQFDHLKINPVPVNIKNKYFSWFKSEFQSLPKKVKKLLLKRVYGWSLVENLGASATILSLYNEFDYKEKGILLFDISLFKKSYKKVCTYKESTVYNLREGESLECDYEGANISFAKAIIYHEAGHLFHNLNPIYANKLKPSNHKFYPFNRLTWIKHGYKKDEVMSKFDNIIPLRNKIKYYSKDEKLKIESNKIEEMLIGWEKSNFFTPYSMTYPSEDWAESFSHYFITKYHKGKFVVRHKNANGKVKSYRSCTNASCSKKKKLIKLYIENFDLFE